jgi:hypothetical protein
MKRDKFNLCCITLCLGIDFKIDPLISMNFFSKFLEKLSLFENSEVITMKFVLPSEESKEMSIKLSTNSFESK